MLGRRGVDGLAERPRMFGLGDGGGSGDDAARPAHEHAPLRALAARASTGGLGRSVESRSRRRGDIKELLLLSQQPSADGLRVMINNN